MLSFHSNDESVKPIAPNIEYLENYIRVSIAGVCNGIVCICSYRDTFLYNPTLREFWELPPSILPRLTDLSPGEKLNGWMDLPMGIGFDSKPNNYKVVRILDPSNEYEFEDFDNHTNAYYWCGYLKACDICVVSFDFSTESFQKHPYPEGLASKGR
ncbi:hypothetical protein H5410_064519, partial [Solanum commersonii]